MIIKEVLVQHRRDFNAILECDHCGKNQSLVNGYDDDYYHCNVIPAIKCESCGKSAGDNYKPVSTKYGAHEVI